MDGIELVCVMCRTNRLMLDPLVLECGCTVMAGVCGGCSTETSLGALKRDCEMHSDGGMYEGQEDAID